MIELSASVGCHYSLCRPGALSDQERLRALYFEVGNLVIYLPSSCFEHFGLALVDSAASSTRKHIRSKQWIPVGDHPLRFERYREAWHTWPLLKDGMHTLRRVNIRSLVSCERVFGAFGVLCSASACSAERCLRWLRSPCLRARQQPDPRARQCSAKCILLSRPAESEFGLSLMPLGLHLVSMQLTCS